MKKYYVFVLASIMFILMTVCSQASNNLPIPADTIVEKQQHEDQQPIITSIDSVDDIVDDEAFQQLFLRRVNNTAFVHKIVGIDALSNFIDEFIEPNKWEKEDTPLIYRAIQHFSIPEETFRKYNSMAIEFNKQRGTTTITYSDKEIAALYCGNVMEMIKQLKSPYAFFNGKELFTVYELLEMHSGEIIEAKIDLNELSAYCDWIQSEIFTHPGIDIEWFEGAFSALSQEISDAAQMIF